MSDRIHTFVGPYSFRCLVGHQIYYPAEYLVLLYVLEVHTMKIGQHFLGMLYIRHPVGYQIQYLAFAGYPANSLLRRNDCCLTYMNYSSVLLSYITVIPERTMVLIVLGNSEIGAQESTEFCYLIYIRHLNRSRAVMDRINFPDKTYVPACEVI